MNISLFKSLWHIISNRHVEENMDRFAVIRMQLMNRYAFLLSFILIIDAIRNLSLERLANFSILFVIGCSLFMLCWNTKIYRSAKIATSVLFVSTLLVFYFCAIGGLHNILTPYYVGVLFAALFIFNEKNKVYSVFIFLCIFMDIYLVQLFNIEIFRAFRIYPIEFYGDQGTTFVQFVLLSAVNGYFMTLKNNELNKLYDQTKHVETPSLHLPAKRSAATVSPSMENVVKLAKENDPAFIPVFKQIFPDFYKNLQQQNQEMTNEEFKFCALLKLNFTTKDIANYNHLAVRSVQTKKGRLRKSFHIPPTKNIYAWVDQF